MAVYLFHSSLSPITISRGIQYDEVLKLTNEGNIVYFLYCNGLMSQCFNNMTGDKAICHKCKSYYKEERKEFGGRINFIPSTSLLNDKKIKSISNYKFDYNNIEDIKNLKYNNINIGLGSLSGYISKSRNLLPLIDDDFKFFFNQNLINSILTVEAVNKAIKKFKPDYIYLYNGRFSDSRVVWQLADKYNIPYTTLEAVYGIKRKYKSRFINSIPHSIEKNTQLINYYWNNSDVDIDDRIRIGSSFFEKRKNAEYSGDKIYTKNQTKDLLPANWDFTKKNIVIFNSSEDEFASIGDEYDKYKLFDSQLVGLKFIKSKLRDNENINITLRVHPNLNSIKYSYATDLIKLKSENFDVIEAGSNISSYALLENADTVIVFGSTIGIESVYWNKPTILLAGAMYYHLNCCYIPNTTDELINMILIDLKPNNRLQAIKYGYYIVNEERESYSVLDFNWPSVEIFSLKNKRRKITVYNWKKLFNSRLLYRLVDELTFKVYKLYYSFYKNKGIRYKLPLKEDINKSGE